MPPRIHRGGDRGEETPIVAEIQAVAIGDIALVGNPFESFNRMGATIPGSSPFPVTRHGLLQRQAGAVSLPYGITTNVERGEGDWLAAASVEALHAIRDTQRGAAAT